MTNIDIYYLLSIAIIALYIPSGFVSALAERMNSQEIEKNVVCALCLAVLCSIIKIA